MKGPKDKTDQEDIINLNDILFKLLKLAVVLFALLLSFRFPVIWIKIPLAVAVLFFGWRWIFKTKKNPRNRIPRSGTSTTGSRKPMSAIERYKAAASQPDAPDHNSVQLLIAYDAAGEFGKAKTLIQSLDGRIFSESVAYELAILAGNYFPVELEPAEDGLRFKLAPSE